MESRYITLADIRRLVIDRIDFVVIDKKSQADITRAILLQVIAEQEQQARAVMSRDFLAQVIRSHGDAMQGVVGSYLEQSMQIFNAQQREIRDRMKQVVGVDPLEIVTQVAESNYQRWRSVQDDIFRTLMNVAGRPRAMTTSRPKIRRLQINRRQGQSARRDAGRPFPSETLREPSR